MRYVDPDGNWFFIDDMLFSLFSILFDNQKCSWWEGTINSFILSWKHPIEHGKTWYSFYTRFFEWANENLGIESYNKAHKFLSNDIEIGVIADFSNKNLTFFFKKGKTKKNGDFNCEIDMSKIQKGNKDEQDIEA